MTENCRSCRRPIHWSPATGWLHGELPQYADQPITCENARPVCEWRTCDHANGPDPLCLCRCHKPTKEAVNHKCCREDFPV